VIIKRRTEGLVDGLTMSVPMVSEERVRGPRSPEGSVSPVVVGDDSYTAMIRNLPFRAESLRGEDLRGIQESLRSLETDLEELVGRWTTNWMENKAHTPKFVEEECLQSLLSYVYQFDDSQSMGRVRAEMENQGFLLYRMRCVKVDRDHRSVPVWRRSERQTV
jgi:hypothetical protein